MVATDDGSVLLLLAEVAGTFGVPRTWQLALLLTGHSGRVSLHDDRFVARARTVRGTRIWVAGFCVDTFIFYDVAANARAIPKRMR